MGPRKKVELCTWCGKVRAKADFPDKAKNLKEQNQVSDAECKNCSGQRRADMERAKCSGEARYFMGCPKTWPQRPSQRRNGSTDYAQKATNERCFVRHAGPWRVTEHGDSNTVRYNLGCFVFLISSLMGE